MANHTTHSEEPAKRHKHEGPKKHIVAYIFSMLLTLVAFATVIGGEINTSFIYILLIIMAIMQVIIQMGFWMHMKDRGHLFPIVGILSGVFVVFTIVIMAEFWTWW
ncbi:MULTISPECIES: cytochrome C oxidase subunit IV family protein [unclassified Paenibacillus]|uniref:cytochrome C oxidase subunit IV family protein n=1 Tax=unclassified Paenibacillus TaxID=185978 RepID=UPI000956FF38|nr:MULTISPECIES: cytochrome C oxidase subunit IV family protein [unclassified Paenibacillus]ASS68522.1 cytochrome C oxidase subunit IV [Paenibacillus sp. RUD330]SIR36061.1 cytochrome c oxidase subunit 4 [Paenibacillus sp. RU4X]SIR46678.1 cytochrome c oxidase subunit 4 [Paenibacillus sp. RU4T]